MTAATWTNQKTGSLFTLLSPFYISLNKVLLAQDVDQRSQVFIKAVEMCDMYQRRAKMLLVRSAIIR